MFLCHFQQQSKGTSLFTTFLYLSLYLLFFFPVRKANKEGPDLTSTQLCAGKNVEAKSRATKIMSPPHLKPKCILG